ncbi:MAG: c-type cytochrome biogenesis protein CcsB [Nitrospira sp.]|nr:c-type cytochrome biogenesis protein CcsB [bacterium]MBL7049838.1 c-type cytochrome biogenesis protein CcsB [Nitrospira sp.]
MQTNILFFELALTFYAISTVAGAIEIFRKKKATSRAALYLAITGFAFHTINIIIRFYEGGHIPVTTMHESASFFSWCLLILFFFHDFRYKLGLLSSFIMPIVFLLMFSSAAFPREVNESIGPMLQSYWFGIHVIFAFLGDAAFAMAAGIGMMYLLQERHLKSKKLDGIFQKLPNLQVLDEINYHLITLGFPLLTLAMITGVMWANSAWGSYWRWDPKEVWSLITWLIYALVLHLRITIGWRGKKAAILSIVGFAIVIFAFFGVTLLLEGQHTFKAF